MGEMRNISNTESWFLSHYFQASRDKLVCLINDITARTGARINNSVGVPAWDQWRIVEINGESFYGMLDHFMEELLEGDLFEKATSQFPDSFGTKDPAAVLRALWESSNYDKNNDHYDEFLRQGSFFSISDQHGKTLKIPLFRQLTDGREDFQGGILHFLKHFEVQGSVVTTASQKHEFTLNTIMAVCEAFFFGTYVDSNKIERPVGNKVVNEFDRTFEFESNSQKFRLILRYSGVCDLFFVSTIYPI